MQQLLNFYAWDVDGVSDDVRAAMAQALGDAKRGVLIVDETGFVKKGTKSAGVARQYSGTAGPDREFPSRGPRRYASPQGNFETKPELARRIIARALEADLLFGWVTVDEAYGGVGRLRSWLEEHSLAHVLAMPKSQMVISMDLRQRRAHTVIADLAEGDGYRLSCGDGVHGQRLYDWVAIDIRPWCQPGYGHWLLARRSITRPGRDRLPATEHGIDISRRLFTR